MSDPSEGNGNTDACFRLLGALRSRGLLDSEAERRLGEICSSGGDAGRLLRELKAMNIYDVEAGRILADGDQGGAARPYLFISALRSGNAELASSVLREHPEVLEDPDAEKEAAEHAGQIPDLRRVLVIALARGMYPVIFIEGALMSMDRETVNALISELSARGLDRQAEYVMHLAVGQGKYWILDKYLERLASQGRINDITMTLSRVDISRLVDGEMALRAAELMHRYGLNDRALKALAMAGRSPGETVLRARILSALGQGQEALQVLREVVQSQETDDETRRLYASLSLTAGKPEEAYRCLNTIISGGRATEEDFIMAIQACKRIADYGSCLSIINRAIERYGQKVSFLRERLEIDKTLGRTAEALSVAQQILEQDPSDSGALEFAVSVLYSNGEYSKVMETIRRSGEAALRKLGNYYLASLIRSGRATEVYPDSPEKEFITDPLCMDAIFFSVRDEESVGHLLSLLKGIRSERRELVKKVLDALRGEVALKGGVEAYSHYGSEALVWLSIESTDAFRSGKLPAGAREQLGNRYRRIQALLENLSSIQSMGEGHDLADTREFMYPVSRFAIRQGRWDLALGILEREPEKNYSDPWYMAVVARALMLKGDLDGSDKVNRKSMERLGTVYSHETQIGIAVALGKPREVIAAVRAASERGFLAHVDWSVLHRACLRMEGLAGDVLAEAEKAGVKNIWVERIRRDCTDAGASVVCRLALGVLRDAETVSEDVRAACRACMSAGLNTELMEALDDLEQRPHDPETSLALGDAYYALGDFRKALLSYREAITLGVQPDKIRNYADTLIETGHLEEADAIIRKMEEPGILKIKMLYKKGDVPGILRALHSLGKVSPVEREWLLYLIRVLWKNQEVRSALIDIYRQGGYSFLGKAIAQKYLEEGNMREAISILENIQGNFPRDVDNARRLASCYETAGDSGAAVSLLTKTLSLLDEPAQRRQVGDELARLLYQSGEYDQLIKMFSRDAELQDPVVLGYLVRSHLRRGDFQRARALIERNRDALGPEACSLLEREIRAEESRVNLLGDVTEIMKAEAKLGRRMGEAEAQKRLGLSQERVSRAYEFLYPRDPHPRYGRDVLERVSADIIPRILKAYRGVTSRDLEIYMVFRAMGFREPELARDLYYYIKQVAGSAAAGQDPLHLSAQLGVGISEAASVSTQVQRGGRG